MKTTDAQEQPTGAGLSWAEKAERLIKDSGKSYRRAEMDAGVPLNTLKKSIRDRATIGAHKGCALARSLGVSADWLFDETKDWDDRPVVHSPEFDPTDPVFQFCRHVALAYKAWRALSGNTPSKNPERSS